MNLDGQNIVWFLEIRIFYTWFYEGRKHYDGKENVKNGGIIMSMITIVDEYGIVEKTVFIDANGNVIN